MNRKCEAKLNLSSQFKKLKKTTARLNFVSFINEELIKINIAPAV